MLNRLPTRDCPSLSMLLADIGAPDAQALASAFDVPKETVTGWIEADAAPRSVLFALFWLTRWGHHAAHCEAHNAAVMSASLAESLQREIARLHEQLRRLGSLSHFGAANDPSPDLPLTPIPRVDLATELRGGLTRQPPSVEAEIARTTELSTEQTDESTAVQTQQPRGLQLG